MWNTSLNFFPRLDSESPMPKIRHIFFFASFWEAGARIPELEALNASFLMAGGFHLQTGDLQTSRRVL